MTLIGYARVSTEEQHLGLQRQALQEAGCRIVIEDEGYSALNVKRPGFERALNSLTRGDVLVVWKLDRAFRSLRDSIETFEHFEKVGIELRSLTEPIEIATSFGKFVYQVRNTVSELERDIIRERTVAGMKAARARGVHVGRPRKLSRSQIFNAQQQLHQNPELSYAAMASRLGVSPKTLTRSLQRYQQEGPMRHV